MNRIDSSRPPNTARKYVFTIGGLVALWAVFVLAVALSGRPAQANDRYERATGKDCSSCHVHVYKDALRLTRYGIAFKRNGCPGVRGGCGR